MQGSFKPLKVPPGEAPAVPMFLINVLVSRPPLEPEDKTQQQRLGWTRPNVQSIPEMQQAALARLRE